MVKSDGNPKKQKVKDLVKGADTKVDLGPRVFILSFQQSVTGDLSDER
jgi:hypothetical protein